MPPRGTRLACSLRSRDNCSGSFDVFPGEHPGSISRVDPVKWDKPPQEPVLEGHFSVIGELGMTRQVILVDQHQWRALTAAKLETFFYGAMLWGKSPLKVIKDAQTKLKRSPPSA